MFLVYPHFVSLSMLIFNLIVLSKWQSHNNFDLYFWSSNIILFHTPNFWHTTSSITVICKSRLLFVFPSLKIIGSPVSIIHGTSVWLGPEIQPWPCLVSQKPYISCPPPPPSFRQGDVRREPIGKSFDGQIWIKNLSANRKTLSTHLLLHVSVVVLT
jgi:hypothetical protein